MKIISTTNVPKLCGSMIIIITTKRFMYSHSTGLTEMLINFKEIEQISKRNASPSIFQNRDKDRKRGRNGIKKDKDRKRE
jgi:hypothetical protein